MGDNLKIVLIYAILFIAVFVVAIHCEAQTIVNDKDFNKTKSGMLGGYLLAIITSTIYVLQYTDKIYIDQRLLEEDLKFLIFDLH